MINTRNRVAEWPSAGNDPFRMTGWTEETVRKAASWQAFKEGKSLFDGGAVLDAKAGQSGWQGAVRAGKRPIRVSVTVKSATDLDTRCSCAMNQSSGAVCAHAVAVALAALAGNARQSPAATREIPPAPPAARAWQVLFPPQWSESLVRGRIAATLSAASDSTISSADERLAAWLAREGVADRGIVHLNLDGGRVSSFLETIADHPRLVAGKEKLPLSIRSGERVRLEDAARHGDCIRLVPAADSAPCMEISGSFWRIAGDEIARVGEGTCPPDIARALARICRGHSVELPVDLIFGQLDAWQEWLAFPDGSWLDSLHFVPAPATFELELEGSLQHLEARLAVAYAGADPVPPGLGRIAGLPRLLADYCEIRNLAAEERAVARLASAGFQPEDISSGRWTLRGESAVLDFLSRLLPDLQSAWKVREGERFARVRKQVALVSPKLTIHGSGEDWLEFDLSFQTSDGAPIPSEEVRRLLRSGYASGKGAGGRHLVVSSECSELVDPLFADLDLRQENGRFIADRRSGEVIREIREKLQKKQETNKLVSDLKFDFPATFQAELRPYQRQGAAWLADRMSRYGGALLADDMGLGKTVQTIALIEQLFSLRSADSGVVLVLATASLLGNWKAEFGRFAPARRVRILHGTSRDSERERVLAGDVVVTSYGTLARDLAWHLKWDYRAVVVDEASLMRNPDTDHAKAIAKLKTSHRVALTGTPVENGVRDLWSIFRFIQPGWLGGRGEFKDRYELPLASGDPAVLERLKLKISPFLLRRTKEQVAPDLPTKLVIDEFCDLSQDQQAVYRELLAEGRRGVEALADTGNQGAARMRMLTALLRLRQTCCDLALLGSERFNRMLVARRSAKLQRLLELIEDAVNGNHRMLIFSQFQTQLLEIEKCVQERGWDCLRLDGQTRNRQPLVDKFQRSDGPPLFLISLKAGGYGLNLTAADTVVHFDPWWNPAAEAQATDRAHRIGQSRPVTVYRLLTRGTVEEKVLRLQARKRELATAIDEGGGGDAAGWTMEELVSVLE